MLVLLNHWTGFMLLFGALFLVIEAGRRVGRRRAQADPAWDNRGLGTIENTLLALLGLLLAFSFSGAWGRFDNRRDLILRETNAIGTAWLRLDLLSEPARESLRSDFRGYVDRRLAESKEGMSRPGAEVVALQSAIWSKALTAAQHAPDARVAQLVLPALNDMFDVATMRYHATQAHPPPLVFLMLMGMMLLAALLAGYGMAGSPRRNWLHMFCFVTAMVLALYVTVELEYPRRGLVRLDGYDRLLVELRADMK